MADTGFFATTAEVQRKVGDNGNATANVEAYIYDFMTQAESFINVATGFNWSDVYSTLNVDVKGILKEAASNLAAIYVLNYGYLLEIADSDRIVQENKISILLYRFNECMKILREVGTNKFISGA